VQQATKVVVLSMSVSERTDARICASGASAYVA